MKLSLFAKFSLLSLLIILFTGFTLGLGIEKFLKESALDQTVNQTVSSAQTLIAHHLSDKDFQQGLSSPKIPGSR